MTDNLSYREFKDEFLLHFAVKTGANTGVRINPEDAAELINDTFQRSWIGSATKDLSDDGYLHGQTFLSGEGSYSLTGRGLERAEEIADAQAADLYELISELGASPITDDKGNALVDDQGNKIILFTGGPNSEDDADIVTIDPLSQAFKELDEQMAITIRDLRGNNTLVENGGAEASQRIAELEAGKALLRAEQADRHLVKRILLPTLSWLLKKVADETAKLGIQKIIVLIGALF